MVQVAQDVLLAYKVMVVYTVSMMELADDTADTTDPADSELAVCTETEALTLVAVDSTLDNLTFYALFPGNGNI